MEQRTASSTAVPGAERTPSSLGWRATLQDMFADRRIMKAAAVVRLLHARCHLPHCSQPWEVCFTNTSA